MQFAEIRAFQELVGHYDAMTLQGGIGGLTVASEGVPSEKQATGFKGAQWFKLVRACGKAARLLSQPSASACLRGCVLRG